jgi:hypothetical protein
MIAVRASGPTHKAGAMEKRLRQRKKTRVPIRFGAERPDRLGLITNVSVRGIYISTNALLPRGSAVRVRVPLPGGDPLVLNGRVTRIRRVPPAFVLTVSGGMGVRLEDVPHAWRASQLLPEDA